MKIAFFPLHPPPNPIPPSPDSHTSWVLMAGARQRKTNTWWIWWVRGQNCRRALSKVVALLKWWPAFQSLVCTVTVFDCTLVEMKGGFFFFWEKFAKIIPGHAWDIKIKIKKKKKVIIKKKTPNKQTKQAYFSITRHTTKQDVCYELQSSQQTLICD